MSLIISRRIGESLLIGNDILVTVHGLRQNQARIAIQASKDLTVHREEIYLRILQEENPQFLPTIITSGLNHSRIMYTYQKCGTCDRFIFRIVTPFVNDIGFCFNCRTEKTIIVGGNQE